MSLLNRFPKWREIAPVYAVISFVVYSWTILWFFWELPGWLYFMTLSEILTNAAYMLATNLVESVVLLLGIIVLSVILPKSFFSSAFIARGVSLAVLGLGYMIFLAYQFGDREDYPSQFVRLIPAVFLLILLVIFFIGRASLPRRIIENFADRTIIFLYILVPLSLLSVVVVVLRNIF